MSCGSNPGPEALGELVLDAGFGVAREPACLHPADVEVKGCFGAAGVAAVQHGLAYQRRTNRSRTAACRPRTPDRPRDPDPCSFPPGCLSS